MITMKPTDRQILTNTRCATFRQCPRKHYLRYELGLAPEEESISLRVGRAYHLLHERADLGEHPESVMDDIDDLDPWDKAMVAAMFTVHAEYWSDQSPQEIVATELSFQLPLRNPASGKESRVWRKAGVIDAIYRIGGRLFIKDYKTTTEAIDPGSDYWTRLMLDQQMSIYVVAARELGFDVEGIYYDVAVRPMHRPKKRTPDDKVKLKKDGTPYAGTQLEDESPEEFAARVAEALRADPGRYFARQEIARTDKDLEEVEAELWMQQLAIREAQRSGRWFRNPHACIGYYRCPYLSICGSDIQRHIAPEGFVYLDDIHPELARVGQATQASEGQASQTDGE